MTTKKELITELISTLTEKYENVHTEAEEKFKANNEALRQFIASQFDMPLDVIHTVAVNDYSTVIYVNDDSSKYTDEITITHPSRYNEGYTLSYYSTQVNESKTNTLYYLELVGKIAKDIRTDKSILKAIQDALEVFKFIKEEPTSLRIRIANLNSELFKLTKNEIIQEMIENGGVEFKTTIQEYIKDNDRDWKLVKEVKIGKVTDKTMTLEYIGESGDLISTYRMNVNQAKDKLYNYHQTNEKLVETLTK